MAEQCGLTIDETLMAPGGHPMLWTRVVRKTMRKSSAPVDLVHAWSRRAALATAFARMEQPIVASVGLSAPTTPIEAWMWKRAIKTKHIAVVAVGAGPHSELATVRSPVKIPLGVDPNYIDEMDRSLRRESWGVDETTFVVALLGEPLAGIDLITAIGGVSRAALAGRDIRLLVHERTADRIDMTRWLEPLGMESLVIVENDVAQPWRVCGAVDAAMCLPTKADFGSPGPMLWAWAGGAPVISSFGDDFRIDGDTESRLPVAAKSPNDVAQRLLRLHDDQALRLRMIESGRNLTREHHNMELCASRLLEFYRGLIDRKPPSVAADAPTGTPGDWHSTEAVAMGAD